MKKSKLVLSPEKLFADVVECNDTLSMDKMDNALHSMIKIQNKKMSAGCAPDNEP